MKPSTDRHVHGGLRLCVEAEPSSADSLAINKRLAEFAAREFKPLDFVPVAVFLRDERDGIRGGLLGWTMWEWFHIDSFLVDEDLRGLGHGKALLAEAEGCARSRGCTLAEVDTFGFQARGFYEKAGYSVFGTLTGIAGRLERYYLRKQL